MMIRGIQLVGIILALAIVFFSYRKYKLKDFSRRDQLFGLFLGIILLTLSINPGVVDSLLAFLSVRDRWLAIFIVSNLGLLTIAFYLFTSLRRTQKDLGELVRDIAKHNYPSNNENPGRKKKIQIVMPAYNEGQSIAQVLTQIPEELNQHTVEPLVVIDGSVDNTEEVVKKLSHSYAAHAINRGQGDALRTGFELSIGSGADIVVTMDADGQHRPEELEKLVKPVLDEQADFVIGSRFLGEYKKDSYIRHAGILFFTRLINLLTGQRITDCTSGYRAFSAESLKKLELTEDKFNAPELILDAAKKDLRIKEVPITIRQRKKGETKKPMLGYAWGLGKTIIKTWLR